MLPFHVSQDFVCPDQGQTLPHYSRISSLESVPWVHRAPFTFLETAELHNAAEDEICVRLMSFQALWVEFGGMEFAGRTRA